MKVNISSELKCKLDVLSSEYNIEIGGYVTGEIKDGEIHLYDLLIPSQNISIASVEIKPEHQVELLKKYGSERCQQILGHWHSHHTMGCFWSPTDYINMKNIMGYENLFVFIVSSKCKHLIKICMKKPLKYDFDDIDFYIRTSRIDKLRSFVNEIVNKNDILNKVNQEEEIKYDE